MYRKLRLFSYVLIFIFIFGWGIYSFAETTTDVPVLFNDVPQNSYAYNDINSLRSLDITNGIPGNNFGYGMNINRAEFVTLLVRLMKWELQTPAKGSFSDNQDTGKYFYKTVETALLKGVIKNDTEKFRPEDPITREEMAVMIVRCLDYDYLSGRLDYLPKPFPDVSENVGYITIAKDLGIINGEGTGFNPKGNALKEQAAVMMMRMYNRLKSPISSLNAYYAIESSPQKDLMSSFSSICFGWSRLTFDGTTGEINLNMVRDGTVLQDHYVPEQFTTRLETARQNNIPALLNVIATQKTKVTDLQTNTTLGLLEYLLSKPEVYRKLISDISEKIENTSRGTETGSFDGVVIDFESMKGEALKQSFNVFLRELREKLGMDKKIFVTVSPVVRMSKEYFDAYDYRTIGEIADKVILMAHDYAPISLTESQMSRGVDFTPLTPADEIYHALRSITDTNTGVLDKSKVMLQFSFNWLCWKKVEEKTINQIPAFYSMSNFMKLFEASPTLYYDEVSRNPYMKFTDTEGIERVVWYEDSRSITEKIKMAKMFGITGISIWRLGNIPDVKAENNSPPYMDVWDNIIKEYKINEVN